MGIKEGRLSKVTTANYGMISGGKARNVVCNYLEIKGEARGHDDKELKEYLAEVDKVFYGTGKERGAKVEIDYKVQYEAFHVKEDEEVIRLAFGVMEDMGLKPEILSAGAGNDGNYFNKYGIKSVGLAVGYNNIHTEEEEQSISELVKCGEMVAGLIRATAKTRS
jgi:tripeptide aminopeptidase